VLLLSKLASATICVGAGCGCVSSSIDRGDSESSKTGDFGLGEEEDDERVGEIGADLIAACEEERECRNVEGNTE
jgi:hypothetical protein